MNIPCHHEPEGGPGMSDRDPLGFANRLRIAENMKYNTPDATSARGKGETEYSRITGIGSRKYLDNRASVGDCGYPVSNWQPEYILPRVLSDYTGISPISGFWDGPKQYDKIPSLKFRSQPWETTRCIWKPGCNHRVPECCRLGIQEFRNSHT